MLSHIPIWVFFLFGGLFVLGLWLGRPRAVSPRLQIIVAVGFLGYSLWGVISAFGIHPAAMLLWAAGVLASVTVLRRSFGPRGLARSEVPSRVQVPGSWAPLALIMGVFLGRFLIGFAQGARLPLVHMLSSGPQCRFFLARYPEALRRAPSRSRALQQGRTARSNHSVKPTCLRHAAYLKR